jgi:hypothetical protein
MPDNGRRTAHPISVTSKISRDLAARLQARADRQQINRAEGLRTLIAALPEPSPHQPAAPRGGNA